MAKQHKYASGDWGTLANEWRRALEADNKSPNTVRIYLHSVRMLGDWATAQDPPLEPVDMDAGAIRDFIKHRIDSTSAGNAHNNYRAIRTFFEWLVEEDELDDTPMRRTSPPILPEKLVPMLTVDQVTAMLATCRGKSFIDRRVEALIRLMWASGSRRQEMGSLDVDDVDLETDCIRVTGKGRRDRVIPFGAKTGKALSRYLRTRKRHPDADSPALWLGTNGKGRLGAHGIHASLLRRAHKAGIGHIHPHMFRHAFAHYWRLEGGNDSDLMRLMGWKSREMLLRYGATAADERAHASARRLRLDDRV